MPFILGTLILTTIAALTVHYPVAANIPINVIIPAAIIFFGSAKPFERLKLSTLIWGRILIAVTALGFVNGALAVQIIFWLLRINILEATVKDFKERNYANAVSGALVLAGSFLLNGTWIVKYFLIHPESILFWCLAYTLWNWNFVLLNFKSSIANFHLAVLAAPLAYMIFAKEIGFWLIMRATSLTVAGCTQVGARVWVEKTFENKLVAGLIKELKKPQAQWLMTLGVLGLSLAAWQL